MKRLLILLILFFFVRISEASHLKGGYITFSHVSERTYSINLVTVSDPNSLADPNTASATIAFGDNSSASVQRTTTVLANSNTRVNTYTTTHTYQAEGNYILSHTDQNLIGDLINVNAGVSEYIPFYIETQLRIDAAVGIITCAIPQSFIPEPIAAQGQNFSYNATFIATRDDLHTLPDPRGDRLEYELVTIPEANHSYPAELTLNAQSGMINWNNVQVRGIDSRYLICYKAVVYRSNIRIAYTVVAQIVTTTPTPSSTPIFPASLNFPSCDPTTDGWYKKTIVSNTPFQQEVSCTNNMYTSEAFGETSLSVTDQSNTSEVKLLMDINADSKMISRDWPYFYNVRLNKDKFSKDYTLAVYFDDLSSGIDDLTSEKGIKTYPNPASKRCNFQLAVTGEYTLTIVDLTGRVVLDTKITGDHYEWDAEDINAGSYFYSIADANGYQSKGELILTN
jgi:hypothetical protein